MMYIPDIVIFDFDNTITRAHTCKGKYLKSYSLSSNATISFLFSIFISSYRKINLLVLHD